MTLQEAIEQRRSVREYTAEPVSREDVEALIQAAILAPSGMNLQNWAFGVLEGAEQVAQWGERARVAMLEELQRNGVTGGFVEHLQKPDTRLFYGAPTVITIYHTGDERMGVVNCTLAAQNLMLKATEMGLGTCWIGLALPLLKQPEVKAELGVPEGYDPVAPIIVGHPAGETDAKPRNAPEMLFWR